MSTQGNCVMEASKFLVGGVWRTSRDTRPVINPYNGSVVGEVCQASSQDIDNAIHAASAAFQKTRQLQSYERANILSYISREVEANKEKFARLITAETGKPISFSRSKVDRSVFTFQYAAEEAKPLEGAVLPLDLAAHASNRFRDCPAISPWCCWGDNAVQLSYQPRRP